MSLLLLIIIPNMITACISLYPNQVQIAFTPGTGINMDKIKELCTTDTCVIDKYENRGVIYEIVTYKVNYEDKKFIIVANSVKSSSMEYTTLSLEFPVNESEYKKVFDEVKSSSAAYERFLTKPYLKEITSIGLRLLIANNVVYGISLDDVIQISNNIDYGNLVYFKPNNCQNSISGSDAKNDNNIYGWLITDCSLDGFSKKGNSYCPKIGCYKCGGGGTFLANLNILPLSFVNSPVDEVSNSTPVNVNPSNSQVKVKSNSIYWIVGIIAIVLIILIIFFFLKIKNKQV